MPARAAEEKGFGLIELVFAMVMLNIGILALVAAFQSGALALNRAAVSSSGTAVADKVMEAYRDLKNCAIYLHGGTGNDSSGLPDGIPNTTSSFYNAYHGDTDAYAGVAYYNNVSPTSTPLWVTEGTTGSGYTPVAATCTGSIPAGLSVDPTKAVQAVTGPDGRSYTVFSYVVIVQPSGTGWSGGYVKQVTVTVLDPQNPPRVLARESSLFDPNVSP